MFDVTMGNFDGAEVCQLVRLFILNDLQQIRNKIGLFQDNELAVFKNTTGPQAEKIRKQITKRFKENGLKITIQCNLKSADYLDATLNLTNVPFQPYRNLSDEPP